MKISFDRKTLLEAVNIATRAADDKAGQVILGYLLISAENGSITITGHDMILTLKVNVVGNADKDGKFTVLGSLFKSIVATQDGDVVELQYKDGANHINFKCGEYESKFPTLPVVDFPQSMTPNSKAQWVIANVGDIRSAVKRTAFAVAVQSQREALNGFLVDCTSDMFAIIATDTHKLGYAQFDAISSSADVKAVVPARAIRDLVALMPAGEKESIKVTFDDKIMLAEMPNLTFVSRLIDDNYVDWNQIVPDSAEQFLEVKRSELIHSLQRAEQIAQFIGNYVQVQFTPKVLTVSTKDQKGISSEDVICEYNGDYNNEDNMSIFIDAKDAIAGLESIESTEILMQFNGPAKLIKVMGKGMEDFTYQVWAPLVPA